MELLSQRFNIDAGNVALFSRCVFGFLPSRKSLNSGQRNRTYDLGRLRGVL